jgi:hypothetical protein
LVRGRPTDRTPPKTAFHNLRSEQPLVEVKMVKILFLLFALTIIFITICVCFTALKTLWRK